VGEYWKDSLDDLDAYLTEFGQQFSVFDTPLHYNFKKAGDEGASYDIRQIFDGTVVQKRPIDAVTLVDNHDTQVGQALESCVPAWFKPLAYSLILLRPDGYPYVCSRQNIPTDAFIQLRILGGFVRLRRSRRQRTASCQPTCRYCEGPKAFRIW
jgi:hypothetical protein